MTAAGAEDRLSSKQRRRKTSLPDNFRHSPVKLRFILKGETPSHSEGASPTSSRQISNVSGSEWKIIRLGDHKAG